MVRGYTQRSHESFGLSLAHFLLWITAAWIAQAIYLPGFLDVPRAFVDAMPLLKPTVLVSLLMTVYLLIGALIGVGYLAKRSPATARTGPGSW